MARGGKGCAKDGRHSMGNVGKRIARRGKNRSQRRVEKVQRLAEAASKAPSPKLAPVDTKASSPKLVADKAPAAAPAAEVEIPPRPVEVTPAKPAAPRKGGPYSAAKRKQKLSQMKQN
eukprot:gnl/TRDRNA2_/TRDRNA2_92944_c0_seq1.p2 gnl/TRDRNA2_/TRDRNA2_92944_c0~~gnl/TRDRNA2_/TRDRNA2_92944_c0_seq1.p2  ORF type:complete len:118 (+),score=24.28 gnl/TRDRNA2_/TRDRNA2_92944_c0_seq1:63-416(+)